MLRTCRGFLRAFAHGSLVLPVFTRWAWKDRPVLPQIVPVNRFSYVLLGQLTVQLAINTMNNTYPGNRMDYRYLPTYPGVRIRYNLPGYVPVCFWQKITMNFRAVLHVPQRRHSGTMFVFPHF